MSVCSRVGFIGAGKMALALTRGFLKAGLVSEPSIIGASCPLADKAFLISFKELGCETSHDNNWLVDRSDIVFLAVKPHLVRKVLEGIRPQSKLIISIAAGLSISQLHSCFQQDKQAKIARVMPNTPSLVGEGATVFSLGKYCSQEDANLIHKFFSSVGECHCVDEKLIDAVTGISGSGPAYMYLIIESMADAGVKNGLPRHLAYRLAAQTMVGAGKMVLKTGEHPAVLKDDVCSPGGSTITAIDKLERSGLRSSIMQAVDGATQRCHEMGSQ